MEGVDCRGQSVGFHYLNTPSAPPHTVWGSGFGVLGSGFWVLDFEFWVLGFRFWILGGGFRVQGFLFCMLCVVCFVFRVSRFVLCVLCSVFWFFVSVFEFEA